MYAWSTRVQLKCILETKYEQTKILIYMKLHVSWIIYLGRVTHICVNKLTTIGSDNGLSPGWRQAIIWTNAGILLIGSLGTNFIEIFIEI